MRLDDPERLRALATTELLDTPPEQRFDRLTAIASQALDVPVALMSLVTPERQFFKSAHGLTGPVATQRQTPLSHSFCRHIVERELPLVVGDARRDPSVCANGAVEDLAVIAYLGVPLRTSDGAILGALCAIQTTPRAWTADDEALLERLAAAAVAEVERGVLLRRGEARFGALLASAVDCVVTLDPAGRIVDFKAAAERVLGRGAADVTGRELSGLVVPADAPAPVRANVARHLPGGDAALLGRPVQFDAVRADGSRLPVELRVTRADVAGTPMFTGHLRDLTEQRRMEAELETAERRFRHLVEQLPCAIHVTEAGADAAVRYASPQVEALTGYAPSAFTDDPGLWQRLVHRDDRARIASALSDATERPRECEYRLVGRDGAVVAVLDRSTVVRDRDGRPVARQHVVLDISALRDAEDRLRSSEALHRSVTENLDEGVLVYDADGVVVACNESASRILGIPAESVVGHRPPFQPCFLEDGTPVDVTNSPTLRVLRTGRPEREVVLRIGRPDGCERLALLNLQPLRDEQRPGLVCSFTDVTERRRTEQQVAHLALHDALTGLGNRRKLEEHLGPALARARRNDRAAALLCLDLDDFKTVNDTLGHAAGDQLLRAVAERLAARARTGDVLTRQGGDEFLLLLPDLAHDEARTVASLVAEDLLAQLDAPFEIDGVEFDIRASVGFAVFPDDAEDPSELLRRGDAALYRVKRAGGRSVGTAEGADTNESKRLTLPAKLRRALRERELILHYQPILDPRSRHPVGVEALVRWHDPERGLVPPGEFIPVAEDTGIIEAIGAWVIDEVIRQAQAWARQGLCPSISFNVSPRQLRRRGFSEMLLAKLAAAEVDPSQFVMEITESAAMAGGDTAARVIDHIAAAGVGIAIDDFGADFSSLSRLRALPVNQLKIDRAFLRDVPDDERAGSLLVAILGVARALGLVAVAEGVESEDQLAFLRRHDCALVQGFLLGRPAAADAVTPLLLDGVHTPVAAPANVGR